MSTILFIDSARPTPQSQIPAGVTGVAGYIGGDTPHIWTKAEWDAQKSRFRLPIYVRSNPPGPGAAVDVAAALASLAILGCPKGSLVAWDMEIAVDSAYIRQVYDLLTAGGYKLIVYASQSFILGEKNPDGLYWGAQWTNVPHINPNDVMTQYISFSNFDLSEAETGLPFWDTAPPPPPPLSVTWIDLAGQLPRISPGASDTKFPHWYVHRVQAILNSVYGAKLAVDGEYGPLSQAALKRVQGLYKLTQDAIVGGATWAVLLAGKSK